MPAPAETPPPFAAFAEELTPQPPLRAAITAATRRSEPDCVRPLLEWATLSPAEATQAQAIARRLVEALRRQHSGTGGVGGLIHEYALSSHEGVALMCLAEALLRIPDDATRDALIRDKLAAGDWRAHLGHSPSLFVNAATWGLVVTGRLAATHSEASLGAALTRLVARGGEPIIRAGIDLTMRMLGQQFVMGQTIEEALANSRRLEARGFRYSYDMLGEAAMTADAATTYLASYEHATAAIGAHAQGGALYERPGISIKLSALHPRYSRAQRPRVMAELLPRLRHLAALSRHHDIGLNIDAEEADRIDLSLDLLEALAMDPAFAGWDGIGFVVQAYNKRCPFIIDWLIELARRTRRRLMVRLVKGAYWDAEIKRAQVDGMPDFPVYTRKAHTDVAFLACARKLLTAPDAVFPQFATHNAATLVGAMTMAGADFAPGRYEFQCLHGMGEPLYEEVVGPDKLDRPCRIYAPVGTHETLLAYLVRRLLENGANTSFVHRLADPSVPVKTLIEDPVAAVRAMPVPGAPHERVALPRDLYGPARRNSASLDLADEGVLRALAGELRESAASPASAVHDATAADIETALAACASGARDWNAQPVARRATILRAAADAFERRRPALLGLLVREAGRTMADAVAEIREAVDYLRYYSAEAERALANATALGPIVCISPWNFPLAIFTGQVAGALAAGNSVIAKPAEQTPLVAAEAVRLLHEVGVPADALRLVPGDGAVGAALVGDARVQGVVFTGSTATARSIQRQLAQRLDGAGRPVTLIAETGGINAMIADSSALAEQLVADVLASAFNSAGQRCSALRLLCLQDDGAEPVLTMLKGAMRELRIGPPDRLDTDIGPVIEAEARDGIMRYIAVMAARGYPVMQRALPPGCADGFFVAPALIEVGRVADVAREVFGPVLHVLRYPRDRLDALIADIDATGYGLTFGLHSRIDETIAHVTGRIAAGNLYVNRNMIGAVVGVQPFGGRGLSGTGPKAGGPLYLRRLVRDLADTGLRAGSEVELPGPVGERNTYGLRPRGRVAAIAATEAGLRVQLEAIRSTGNQAIVIGKTHAATLAEAGDIAAVLFEGDADAAIAVARELAVREGPIVPLQALTTAALQRGEGYDLNQLREEYAVSINTAAAGGNASLMTIG
jgi:RHH-type proline utilization regulon transcriptional repressor/proline dehydrogenase/delta 1-pyrroline-5-carboxylate dehydrogenase